MRLLFIFISVFLLLGCQATSILSSAEPSESGAPDELMHPVENVTEALSSIELPVELSPTETPEDITNLWTYIAKNANTLEGQHPRITAQQKWYNKHPHYMQRVSERARPFMYYIVNTLEQHDLPLELALLPIVESAFDPFAYSHGSASGLWQFIPSTGKRFGMAQNWWYDGRRDVVKATEGAIGYLSYLHRFFDGNWYHALAAYNSGEGRVRRAINKNKRAGKPTDFWSLDLPKETRQYVPKLIALINLLKQQVVDDNLNWPEIANAPVLEIVTMDAQIDLAIAADFAELTLQELHALNPGFNRWATAPDGPHHLLLPIQKIETFEQQLAQTKAQERINWVRYQVQSGDNLGAIAQAHHTSIDIIKQVNELNGNSIFQDDYLLVPVALKSLDQYTLSKTQRLATIKDKRQRSEHAKLTHIIKQGDSLWDLARKYKVSTRALAKWNGIAPKDPIYPGKKLVVWLPNDKPSGIVRNITYIVKNGDSLARIGQKFNVKINDIVNWNQLDKGKYLQPGQRLRLSVDVTRMETAS